MNSMTLDAIVEKKSALLDELGRRQNVVRDFVRGVACEYATGL